MALRAANRRAASLEAAPPEVAEYRAFPGIKPNLALVTASNEKQTPK